LDQDRCQSFECNAPDVIFENFGDETVLLNLQSGKYYSLNPVAMFVWEILCQGVPPEEIATHLTASYNGAADPPAIAADLDALVQALRAETLIRLSPQSRSISQAATAGQLPEQYLRPAIAAFDDVAELLLLDPVHDVSEVGWPHPAALNQERE
jgi:hypothetical protein